MKHIHLLLMAAGALSALSCAKETGLVPSSARKVSITASIAPGQDTKVSLTEADDHKAMKLAWEQADILSINGNEFAITSIVSEHEAQFEGEEPEQSPYTIIYPGNYADAEAFGARSYAAQAQSGNGSTAHLEYNAMVKNVTEYANVSFTPEWAQAHSGTLEQNGAIQLRLQLPEAVTTASAVTLIASRAVFPVTNAGSSTKSKEQTLTLSNVALPSNHILEAYMMFSAAGVTFQSGDKLTVAVETPDAMFYRTLDMTAQTWTGGRQYTVQCKVLTENSFDINNADALEEFRDGVNSGDMLWQHCHVSLTTDLDLSGLGSWTPIGNGTFNNSDYSVTGNAFKGCFDGGNHVLRNLQLSGSPAANAPYGLFGILDGATVQNLVLGAESGDSGSFSVTPSGILEAGIVAGVARSATIQNVTNYSPLSILENTSTGAAFFGMVGYLIGTAAGRTHLDHVVNYGTINAHGGNNTGNGGTGFNVAGIAGFSHTNKTGVLNLIENCENHGDITASTGRAAGILGAANARTSLDHCTNRGHIFDSFSNGRIAGVCVILGTGSAMSDCSNYGDVIVSQDNTQLGGLVCLLNADDVTVSGGGNHGRILGDITTYHGTLVANFSKFASVSNVTAGGAYGSYNGGDYQYTVLDEDNYMSYIGKNGNNNSKVTGISFEAWDGYPDANVTTISNAAELLAFAAKVNAGKFAATDVAKLTADIDCSSITAWTPIGAGTFSFASNHLTINSGHPFEGTFDGNGKTIMNLHQSYTTATAGGAYGLFGMLADGAVIKNLTFDNGCSLSVTASASGDFGVLAGLIQGATIQDITSYASISGGGTNSLGANRVTMAIIGFAFVNNVAATIERAINRGQITAVNGNNTNNGGSGVQAAGILGFGTNDASSTATVNVKSCANHGAMSGDIARLSGIVASCNRYTVITDCTNYGKQVNTASHSNKTRGGNITCITGVGSQLIRCINMGDLIASGTCQPGGVIGMPNHEKNVINGCENYGRIVAASDITGKGTLFGYCNNTTSFTNCVAGGDLGTYVDGENDTMVGVNANNYSQYWGLKGANATNVTTANIIWKASPTE